MNRRIKNKQLSRQYQALINNEQISFASRLRFKNIRRLREKKSLLEILERLVLFIKNEHSTEGVSFSYRSVIVC